MQIDDETYNFKLLKFYFPLQLIKTVSYLIDLSIKYFASPANRFEPNG